MTGFPELFAGVKFAPRLVEAAKALQAEPVFNADIANVVVSTIVDVVGAFTRWCVGALSIVTVFAIECRLLRRWVRLRALPQPLCLGS